MINENALVAYKGKLAIVKERTGASSGDKYNITLIYGTQAKVREKDIELLHPGPVKNFDGISADESDPVRDAPVREVWELLSGEDGSPLALKELAGFLYSEYTPVTAASAYRVLQDGLFFTGTIDAIVLRREDEVKTEEAKREEKIRDGEERAQFLEKCRKNLLTKDDLPGASRFVQDVEALALGKSVKSRTMKELKLNQTPEDAHDFLLKTGIWQPTVNPYPARYGISLNQFYGNDAVTPPPEEDRRILCHLETFAIDSPWTGDPDDAVSIEYNEQLSESVLFVHVADPASVIKPDSPIEKEARNRGATLYLPETTVRMLPDECLPLFALGLNEKSCALSFIMTISKEGEITNTEIVPSIIKARRMTYAEADIEMETNKSLRALNELTQRIYMRRIKNGAIDIDLPDVHINIKNKEVKIEPIPKYQSAFMIRECMIAAGEGAAAWANGIYGEKIPIPYLSQEAEIPNTVLPGLAGSMQLRKSMRPRALSVKPGRHQGMGLDIYTQVTSPLRRYTDLLTHMQIRAFLNGDKPLDEDEVSARFGYSEAAITACVQAERASDIHWKMVYLMDKKDSVWNAAAVEKRMKNWLVIIPDLALETHVTLQKDTAPNDEVKLVLKSVNIARGEAVFVSC